MDRRARKANLKKLQQPKKNSTCRQTSSTNSACSTVAKYFLDVPENKNTSIVNSQTPSTSQQLNGCLDIEEKNKTEVTTPLNSQHQINEPKKAISPQRTKLKTFLRNKDSLMDADDFEIFEKGKPKNSVNMKMKTKRKEEIKTNLPKRSITSKRAKRHQPSIKSAFLRNEQLFSEITAQHCLADNFSPDDLQLALAISKSEAEAKGIICVDNETETVVDIDKNSDAVQDCIRDKLRCYGFRTAPEKDYQTITAAIKPAYFLNRRVRAKWANKFTALTLRDPVLQQKKVNERVNDILCKISDIVLVNTDNDDDFTKPYSFELNSFVLNRLKSEPPAEEVYRKAKYFETITTDAFYVNSLFEISHIKSGHLLKDWSRIQGRDKSPINKSPQKMKAEKLKNVKFMKAYQQLEIIFSKTLNQNESIIGDQLMVVDVQPEEESISEDKAIESGHHLEISDDLTICKDNYKEKNEEMDLEIARINPAVTADDLKTPLEVRVNNVVFEEQSTKSLDEYEKTENQSNNFENKTKSTCDTLTPLKGPPDKRPKLQTPGLKTINCCSMNLAQLVRGNSPDLFADSDDEGDDSTSGIKSNLSKTDDTDKEEIPCAPVDQNGIENYERFTSNDVKTSPKTNKKTKDFEENTIRIDLTNDDTPQICSKRSSNLQDYNIFSTSLDLLKTNENENSARHSISEGEELVEANDITKDDCAKLSELGSPKENKDRDKSKSLPLTIRLSKDFSPAYDFNVGILNKDDIFQTLKDKNHCADSVRSTAKGRCASLSQITRKPLNYSRKRLSFTQMEQKAYSVTEKNDLFSEDFGKNTLNCRNNSSSITPSFSNDEASVSIDLTQTSEDSKDDECIILSDDEINYSIWKAEKTLNLQFDEESVICSQDLNLTSDSDDEDNDDENVDMKINNGTDLSDPYSSDKDSITEKKLNTRHSEEANDFKIKRQKALSFTQLEENIYNGMECNNNLRQYSNINIIDRRSKSIFLSTPNFGMTNLSTPIFRKTQKSVINNISPKHLSFSQFEQEAHNENVNILNSRRSKTARISANEDHEATLDLTQNSIESPKEDDCLIISDDEINYSLNREYKSMSLNHDNIEGNLRKDGMYSPNLDDSQNIFQKNETEKKKIGCEGISNTVDVKECSLVFDNNFSFLELLGIDDDRDTNNREIHNSFNFHENEEAIEQQDIIYSESDDLYFYATPERINESNRKCSDLERITDTPLNTPATERFRSKSEETLSDLSSLETPSAKCAPMKRYSSLRGTQKFNSLLRQVQMEQANAVANSPFISNMDDFDEFDKVVYGSPKNVTKELILKDPSPAGLHKLLTAEINVCSSPNNDKDKLLIPSKISMDSSFSSCTESNINACYDTPKSSLDTEVQLHAKANSKEILHINGKVYEVRITTTPKPNFNALSDGELMKQIYRYGMKPLQRKQALLMLEYIYNQTHPILGDKVEEAEDKVEVRETIAEMEEDVESEPAVQEVESSCMATQTEKSLNKFNLSDCFGHLLLRYRHYLHAELPNENYIFQTNVNKKTPQPLLPLHVAWFNLVCSSNALHEAIITFQPIDFQEIYLFLKSIGYRYDPKDLKTFFDSRCIIFRYEMGPSGKSNGDNRHIRKSKIETKVK